MNRCTKLSTLLALGLLACAGSQKYQVSASDRAPGADAEIVAKRLEEHHHTQVEIEAKHLPPPARVASGKSFYTVWYRRDAQSEWQRLGNLDYDDSDRTGKLTATTPEREFELKISAESDTASASPSDEVVFSKRVKS